MVIAFLGFWLIASSIYIINDWRDIEADKIHPKKKKRPLAAGIITKKIALITSGLCLISGLLLYIVFIANTQATSMIIIYVILNIAYCFKLKQIAIIDIAIVAVGFDIRLFIGGAVTGIILSQWIVLLTFLLALLLVVGKRRHDVLMYEITGQSIRKSLKGYNIEFINSIIIINVCSIILCYLMYTISDEVVNRNGKFLYFSSIFVILGLFRYLQVIYVKKKGDSPTELLIKDRFLQIDIIFWLISFIFIINNK